MIINKDVMIPLFTAFMISVVLSPFVIPFLQRLKVGQTEREEGVKSHLKKAGTPTMGGLIILISLTVTSLFYIGRFPRLVPVLFLVLGFGIIGFLDDYLKVVLRRSDGLYPRQKMLGQIIVIGLCHLQNGREQGTARGLRCLLGGGVSLPFRCGDCLPGGGEQI